MNEMLLAYDPNSPARHDQKLRIIAKMVYEKEDISVSELFRRIISQP